MKKLVKKKKGWASQTVGASTITDMTARVKTLDGYHTPSVATQMLIDNVKLGPKSWECANGYGRITRVLKRNGKKVFTSDIHRWHKSTIRRRSFFLFEKMPKGCTDIITNPPFKHAQAFVTKAMELLPKGGKLCLLLRLQFMEGQKRKLMFQKYPPQVYVFSFRLPRMHRFGHIKEGGKSSGSVLAFAWFVFTKGSKEPSRNFWL